jgi:hypothetical protein
MFIPPMLCTQVRGAHWLDNPRYVAEPKLDGQLGRGVLRAVEMVHAADRLRPVLAAVLPVLRNSGPERLPGAPPRPRTARGPWISLPRPVSR